MYGIDHGTGEPYRGPERRYAFFPRRMRSGESPGGQGTDRRSGKDRRKHDGPDDSAPVERNGGT